MVLSSHELEKIIDAQRGCHIIPQWVRVDNWGLSEILIKERGHPVFLIVDYAKWCYGPRFYAEQLH